MRVLKSYLVLDAHSYHLLLTDTFLEARMQRLLLIPHSTALTNTSTQACR